MQQNNNARLSTGVEGLDQVLKGGLIERRAYLVRGGPGQGKTTLGLHFLEAANDADNALFIGFQEPAEQIRANAAQAIDMARIKFLTLIPNSEFFTEQQGYDVFSAADVEQEPIATAIVEAVKVHRPKRVFVDSLTQLRFLSADEFQYRKQVMSFLRFLTDQGATVLFSSESTPEMPDDDLQFMSDGVIHCEPGTTGSAIRISKFRGSGFVRGEHHMRLSAQGMNVFPRMLVPRSRQKAASDRSFGSGSATLDRILQGGVEAGTVTLITGPSGVGKSTLATQFALDAAKQGRAAAVFLFEEELSIFLRRSKSLGMDPSATMEKGLLAIEPIEPMRYLADEFVNEVLQHVEEHDVELVVLDSVGGFELALEGEGIEERLHTFAKTLARMGVTVILVNETQALTGQQFKATERGISYLSDNVLFLRYIEVESDLRKTIGVLKKRLSGFDANMRCFEIGNGGLQVDAPIEGLQGVLSGMPSTQDEGE